ncbi:MAG: hypothetical protein AAF587_00015 [Bacteroidota bacterium]
MIHHIPILTVWYISQKLMSNLQAIQDKKIPSLNSHDPPTRTLAKGGMYRQGL